MAPAVSGLQLLGQEELAAARRAQAQQKRRNEALHRQKAGRHDAVAHARQLALEALSSGDVKPRDGQGQHGVAAGQQQVVVASLPAPAEEEGAADSPMESGGPARRRRTSDARDALANALMLPEWLLDVPPDLATAWLVTPRPEGTRCVVVAARGATSARRRDGSPLVPHFPSQLPAGSASTAEAVESVTILDCILHAVDRTFYILDAMCWRGYNLYDCTTEFRHYWLHTKLSEYGTVAAAAAAPTHGWRYRFVPLHAVAADKGGVLAAARHSSTSPPPFRVDGLLLLHREALYTPCPSIPLALAWKDGGCSPHVLDTDAQGSPLPHQVVVLAVSPGGDVLLTDDDPPAALTTLAACIWPPAGSLDGMSAAAPGAGTQLQPGTLVRLAAPPGAVAVDDDATWRVVAPLIVLGVAPSRRGRPDTLSKVAFQAAMRAGAAVTLDMLLAAAAGV